MLAIASDVGDYMKLIICCTQGGIGYVKEKKESFNG